MIDLVKFTLIAGNGGNGAVSFRREKYVAKGGPDGGMGGNGGNIIIRGKKGLSTLRHFAGISKITSKPGNRGSKKKMTGARGEDTILEVPLGTTVWSSVANKISNRRSSMYKIEHTLSRSDVSFEKYILEKEGQGIFVQGSDDLEMPESKAEEESKKMKLKEITEHNQEIIICQGGFGGRGNDSFKGPANTTPLEAEFGTFGEQKLVTLELKLLADIGLVGFPNAGKSTLLSKLTKARPKIANYPFTTLEPNLGVMRTDAGKELVIADIPGLIEGASDGKGLGLDFLRHVENCRVLWFVLYLDESIVFDESLDVDTKAKMIVQQYDDLIEELKSYSGNRKLGGDGLIQKPNIVTLNKIDIYSAELIDTLLDLFMQKDIKVTPFSAVTGDGLEVIEKLVFSESLEA